MARDADQTVPIRKRAIIVRDTPLFRASALGRPFPTRPLYGALAVLLGGGIASLMVWQGIDGKYVLAFALAPDIALLIGIAPVLARGQLHPRAVPIYNVLHTFVGPLLAVAALLGLGLPWLAGALAWGAHIAVDRCLGFGFRTRAGFIRE